MTTKTAAKAIDSTTNNTTKTTKKTPTKEKKVTEIQGISETPEVSEVLGISEPSEIPEVPETADLPQVPEAPLEPHKPPEITIEQLREISLFRGADDEELRYFLDHIPHSTRMYVKDDCVVSYGDYMEAIGVLLEGMLGDTTVNAEGVLQANRHYRAGEIIGLSALGSDKKTAPSTIIAEFDSEILWIDYEKLVHIGETPSRLVRKVIPNIIRIFAEGVIHNFVRFDAVANFTTQERLMAYLNTLAVKRGSHTFTLDMSQPELAKYLNVARQTLVTAMTGLRSEGIIDYEGKGMEITILGEIKKRNTKKGK